MQAYRAYYESGRFIPLETVLLPEGSHVIVTVLEESPEEVSRRQREAMERFRKAVRTSGPLPSDFDDIINQRVNITREIDL